MSKKRGKSGVDVFVIVRWNTKKKHKGLGFQLKAQKAFCSYEEAKKETIRLNLENRGFNNTYIFRTFHAKIKDLNDQSQTIEDLKQMTIEMQHEIDGQYSQLSHIEKLLEDDIRDEETTEDAIERIVKDSRIVGLQRHFAKLAGYLDDNRRMHEERSQPSKKFKVTGEPKGWSYTETLAVNLGEAHAIEAMKGAIAAEYKNVQLVEDTDEDGTEEE